VANKRLKLLSVSGSAKFKFQFDLILSAKHHFHSSPLTVVSSITVAAFKTLKLLFMVTCLLSVNGIIQFL
jgi:hypothetical protein